VVLGSKEGEIVEIKRGISASDGILLPASSENNKQVTPAS
jgi:hypothetical protein